MSTMEKSRRGGSAAPSTSEERRQEPGYKTPGHGTELKAKGVCSEKAKKSECIINMNV